MVFLCNSVPHARGVVHVYAGLVCCMYWTGVLYVLDWCFVFTELVCWTHWTGIVGHCRSGHCVEDCHGVEGVIVEVVYWAVVLCCKYWTGVSYVLDWCGVCTGLVWCMY